MSGIILCKQCSVGTNLLEILPKFPSPYSASCSQCIPYYFSLTVGGFDVWFQLLKLGRGQDDIVSIAMVASCQNEKISSYV